MKLDDRVTLVDKYMYRAGDIGTIEAITLQGIQVTWDRLPQPPMLWRTFSEYELELIKE